MMVAGSLSIALVSYDAGDEGAADVHVPDLLKVLTGDPAARAKADVARNGLGLVGAITLPNSSIKSTVGYAVFVLPLLMLLWGWNILAKETSEEPLS